MAASADGSSSAQTRRPAGGSRRVTTLPTKVAAPVRTVPATSTSLAVTMTLASLSRDRPCRVLRSHSHPVATAALTSSSYQESLVLSRAPLAFAVGPSAAPGCSSARASVGPLNAAAAKPRRPIEAAVVCTIIIIVTTVSSGEQPEDCSRPIRAQYVEVHAGREPDCTGRKGAVEHLHHREAAVVTSSASGGVGREVALRIQRQPLWELTLDELTDGNSGDGRERGSDGGEILQPDRIVGRLIEVALRPQGVLLDQPAPRKHRVRRDVVPAPQPPDPG